MEKVLYYTKKLKLYIFLILILIVVLFCFFYNRQNNDNTKREFVIENKIEAKEKVEVKKEESNKIKVDVKGRVNNPGVYELESNMRVIDAINLAGGLLEDANTEYLNLSKYLKDEMVIIVYSNNELEKFKETEKQIIYIEYECKCPDNKNDACINNKDTVNTNGIKNKDSNDDTNENISVEFPISINEATEEELLKIPGIGESKAKAIISYREEFGPFINLEDIKNVSGIGESLYNKIKEYIKL